MVQIEDAELGRFENCIIHDCIRCFGEYAPGWNGDAGGPM